jgi:dienelactone hydrolase
MPSTVAAPEGLVGAPTAGQDDPMTDNVVDASVALPGWSPEEYTAAGTTHTVFTRGTGPGVVLLPEIPGVTPEVLGLADHLVDSGFTVAVINLFGDPGRPVSPGYAAGSFAKACISREFAAFARRADRPVAEYVRAVARELHGRAGGPGVGVIGMCFSGGFALASAVEPAVLAPVASQPSLPLPLTPGRRRDVGMSDRERDVIAGRVRDEGLCLVGLRFSEDSGSPTDRFRALRAAFGDGWLPIQLNSRPGNPAGIGKSEHMVLTSKDADTPGHPTNEARAQVVAFLRERLAGVPAARP